MRWAFVVSGLIAAAGDARADGHAGRADDGRVATVRPPDGAFLEPDGVAGRPQAFTPFTGYAVDAVLAAAGERDDDRPAVVGEAGVDASAGVTGTQAVPDALQPIDPATGAPVHVMSAVRGWAAAGASARVRLGAPLGVTSWAQVGYAWLPDARGDGLGVFPMVVSHDGALGVMPGLGARRDRGRGAFDDEQLGVETVGLRVMHRGRRLDFLTIGLGSAWQVQGDAHHHQTGARFEMITLCARRATCLGVMAGDMLGVEGDASAAVMTLAPLRLAGLRLGGITVDARGGLAMLGTMTVSTGDQTHVIPTEDLPDLAVGTYDLRIARAGRYGFEARARRELYVTTAGDLSVEERAELSIKLSGRRTSIAARGFAARTRWWTSADDPGTAAATGGGELAVTRWQGGFALGAQVAVARSFYAALDDAAAGSPALGMRASLELRRRM